jgi:hypothetical protein
VVHGKSSRIFTEKNRPISIIITTLAAKAYGNQSDLYDALISVATRMHEYIEKRDNGEWWVVGQCPNP